MRVMDPIKDDFKSRGVEFVAVNIWDEPEVAEKFARDSAYDYRWARTNDVSIERLGIKKVPTMIVVDGEGRVAWRSGLFTFLRGGADLRETLEELTRG